MIIGVAIVYGLMAANKLQHSTEKEQKQIITIDKQIKSEALRAPLSMLFNGKTEQDFRQWKALFKNKLLSLLGDFSPPKKWSIIKKDLKEYDNFTRHELILVAEGFPALSVYLLVPHGAEKSPRPGLVCVHGHGNFANHSVVGRTDIRGVAEEIEKYNYDYGLKLVRQGYVVAAPCMIPFGSRVDRKKYNWNDPCAVTFVRMQALGKLPISENIRYLKWTIDLLESRPEVRKEEIGCVGLSYGGRMTMMVSALDERIKVAVISGALNLLQERILTRYSCGLQIIPELLLYGDYSEIASLIAPRPCLWEVGLQDKLIEKEWADIFKARLIKAYSALNAKDQLHFDYFEGRHRWHGDKAYEFLKDVFK